MKILRSPILRTHRWVNYHGVTVWIPRTAVALAVDSTNRLYWYDVIPFIQDDQWFTNSGMVGAVADVDLEGLDWTESMAILTTAPAHKLHAV